MDIIEMRLHRLSTRQLKALKEIAEAPNCLVSSVQTAERIGATGKSLGGVYSSLARQTVRKQPLIVPWGKADNSRGLRWKLNETVVSQKQLIEVINRLLQY